MWYYNYLFFTFRQCALNTLMGNTPSGYEQFKNILITTFWNYVYSRLHNIDSEHIEANKTVKG